jgi:heme A synthase
MIRLSKFALYSWFVLLVNLFVILWGVYVRASGSGAGCGSHWPLCNGVVIPISPQIETIIEFTHRLSSGLSLILVVVMFIWAYRAFPRKHIVRFGATLSLIFIFTEALVGAGLVLFEWVAHDASTGRVISMAIHLVNTFLLLAALTLTGWWATTGESISLKKNKLLLWVFGFAFLGVIALGVSGAITALGDTLFPAQSLVEGIQQDFSPTAHFVIRLRVWHPVLAIIIGAYLILLGGLLAMYANDESRKVHQQNELDYGYLERHYQLVKNFSIILICAVVAQLLAGLINLLLLAPVWMQLVHLFLADFVWISLVLLAANTFSKASIPETISETSKSTGSSSISNLQVGANLAKYID